MKISELKAGEKAIIKKIKNDYPEYRHKLLSMGLIPGTEFSLVRVAPLGDPIQISVRDFSLALRKKEAEVLVIEKSPA